MRNSCQHGDGYLESYSTALKKKIEKEMEGARNWPVSLRCQHVGSYLVFRGGSSGGEGERWWSEFAEWVQCVR